MHITIGGENDMIDKINIEKDHIEFGNIKVHPPFTREKVDAVLGVPEIKEKDIEITYKAPRPKTSIYDSEEADMGWGTQCVPPDLSFLGR